MKKEVKKRFALLLSAIFAFTLIFNVMGANAETPTGSAYNTPTGNAYNATTDNKDNKTEGDKTKKVEVIYCYPTGNYAHGYPADGYATGSGYFLLDKNNPNELLDDDGKKFKPSDMTEGLDYSWVVDFNSDNDLVWAYAKTSNFQVTYDIEGISDDLYEKLMQPKIVSAGTKITLPSTVEGKSVRWYYVTSYNGSEPTNSMIMNNVYTVNSNMAFHGSIDGANQIIKPDEDLQKDDISTLNNAVNSGEKDTYIGLGNNHKYWCDWIISILPKEYLDVIKGHDINLNIEMEDLYSWTINGKNIKDTSDIDLGIYCKGTVPDDAVASLAGSNDSRQISLAHNGTFGFDAKLTLNFDEANKSNKSNKFANLFWYKPDGTFQFMQSAKIDKDGHADFDFSHASDYVIVLTDKAMNAEDATEANEKIIANKVSNNTSAAKSTETNDTSAAKSTKTTDTSAAKATKTTDKSSAKSTKTTLKSPKTGEF